MRPSFSIIFFTVLSGAGYGLWFLTGIDLLWHGMVCGSPSAPDATEVTLRLCFAGSMGMPPLLLGFALVTVGLLSSVAHLGQPQRAWRALSQWRTSWLSREGIAALFTYLPFFALMSWPAFQISLRLFGALLALGSLATVYCTANIYSSLKPIRAWHDRHVVAVYLLFSLATGGLLIALFAHRHVVVWMSIGLIAATVLAAIKRSYWSAIDRIELPTREAATALEGYGSVMSFECPHTEANYLTREMGFVLARKHSRKLRAIALLLFAGLPLLALVIARLMPAAEPFAYWTAALSALLGAFVERWLFFAEAKHMVTLYY
jgi:DMSO reductase anchor subunit